MSQFKFEIGDNVIYDNNHKGRIILREIYGHNNVQYRVEFPKNITIYIGIKETNKRSISVHEKDIKLDVQKVRNKKIDYLLN